MLYLISGQMIVDRQAITISNTRAMVIKLNSVIFLH